jgi:hypothetical protein
MVVEQVLLVVLEGRGDLVETVVQAELEVTEELVEQEGMEELVELEETEL